MIYAIVMPDNDYPIALMYSDGPPSTEEMADHVTRVLAFKDREALLLANPGLSLACLPMQ